MVTGVWPILHFPSFEALTGPKDDEWLVHTVGLLAGVIGAVLCLAAIRGRYRAAEIVALAGGSALAFAGIDLWYGLSGRIPAIYLADAGVQFIWLVLLGFTSRRPPAQ